MESELENNDSVEIIESEPIVESIDYFSELSTIIDLLSDNSRIDRIIELLTWILGFQVLLIPFAIIGVFLLGVKAGNGN